MNKPAEIVFYVQALEGPHKGEKYIVKTDSTVLIGRHPRSNISLNKDSKVSSRHALISWDSTGCWIEDLKSTNGTYLNGKFIERVLLQDKDILDIGDTRLRIRAQHL